MTKLASKRLQFEPPCPADAPALAAALNDFTVAKNLATAPHPYGEQDASAFIQKVTEGRARGEAYCFVLRRKTGGQLVGCTGLHLHSGFYELGYWIAKPFWRQGFATEAAGRLLQFAFDDLQAAEVWAGWYHDNAISGRVLSTHGFTADHVEKQYSLARGENVLCNRARLTAADFRRKKAA